MAQQHGGQAGSQGGSFGRAFLPGLILGLVVGGFAGAVLPTIIAGGTRAPDPAVGTSPRPAGDRDERVDREPLPPEVQEAIDAAEQGADLDPDDTPPVPTPGTADGDDGSATSGSATP